MQKKTYSDDEPFSVDIMTQQERFRSDVYYKYWITLSRLNGSNSGFSQWMADFSTAIKYFREHSIVLEWKQMSKAFSLTRENEIIAACDTLDYIEQRILWPQRLPLIRRIFLTIFIKHTDWGVLPHTGSDIELRLAHILISYGNLITDDYDTFALRSRVLPLLDLKD